MRTCEDIAQQARLFHAWLEAAPFLTYHGWQIRACPEGEEWIWEVMDPPEYGCGYFESGRTYPSASRALLAARRLVRSLTVSHELTIVLEEFQNQGILHPHESQALISSTQSISALIPA
jgi:hypothetical protein